MSDLVIFQGFTQVLKEAAAAVLPLLVLLLLFRPLLKLPRSLIKNTLKGLLIAFLGLILFLQGIKAGFLPIGREIGAALGSSSFAWSLIPVGLLLGFAATFAEPAVRILSSQVEKSSSGYIPSKLILYTLSISVALVTALGMIKLLYGFPIYYLVVPGYILALVMLKFSQPAFIGIAFDSAGVATGPIAVTLIMAVAVGAAAELEGRDPVLDGFGIIALIALAPILLVLILGIIYPQQGEEDSESEVENKRGTGEEVESVIGEAVKKKEESLSNTNLQGGNGNDTGP
ncbi:MAG: DUF1538 domain-containing protein [Firmicutes bacterium]|nr:DUF1538 domain-containing protein [Bacillota bacterium]